MHATLSELLENLQPGMLWVSRDGLVRFSNAQAAAKLRLNSGSRLQEPTLINAVNGTVIEQTPRTVMICGQPAGPGEPVPELRCKVLPGLSRDDAMVLVTDSADEHAAVGFDNLMQVIRSDLRDPLSLLTQSLVVARNDRDVHALDALGDALQVATHRWQLGVAQILGDPLHQVGHAARREAHDELHRTRRPRLRGRGQRDQRGDADPQQPAAA